MRESGVLFPVFSLPSKFGVGCFSKEAFDFVDFLYNSGQGFWQILPLGPLGYGNSPYQPISAFAGNPYFISPEKLTWDGLLTWDEANACDFGNDESKVDYGALYENREKLLKTASERFYKKLEEDPDSKEAKEFAEFKEREGFWLDDYALFISIKKQEEGRSWLDWKDDGLRMRKPEALKKASEEFSDEIAFVEFEQYEFDCQWRALREHAKEKNVKVIGDMPFYVALDSADAWSCPKVFLMDKDLVPTVVAGCPPDAFSATGQRWGNPIYDWKSLKADGYDWWVKRIERNFELFDVIRIDHFHGFCDYYAIPYKDETAEKGELCKGPGLDLFEALKKKISRLADEDTLSIIAEDLGNNTPENEKLLADTGFPGMKVLQYAFTSWDSYYVNHRHTFNSVVYTGTHDNNTTMAWMNEINEGSRDFARRYINSVNTDNGQFVWDFIREAYRSVCMLSIIPLQDYLCMGSEARINTPGTGDGNWQWRLRPNVLSQELEKSIRGLTELYGRIPKAPEVRVGDVKNAQ